jgi:DNA-binding XRE family transcriptional regulator
LAGEGVQVIYAVKVYDLMKVALFDTIKSKKGISNEVKRQREIIAYLASEYDPEARTRIAIAHALAEKFNTRWQNIYSSVFRDIDEILIPANIVKEQGRLPPKRGPRALQHEGVPYYALTQAGMLIAACLDELDSRVEVVKECITSIEQDELREGLSLLLDIAPSLVLRLVKEYVSYYDLSIMIPITIDKIRNALAVSIRSELELLEAFMSLSKEERGYLLNFLRMLSK